MSYTYPRRPKTRAETPNDRRAMLLVDVVRAFERLDTPGHYCRECDLRAIHIVRAARFAGFNVDAPEVDAWGAAFAKVGPEGKLPPYPLSRDVVELLAECAEAEDYLELMQLADLVLEEMGRPEPDGMLQ